MSLPARRAATIVACSMLLLPAAVSGASAQRGGADPCRRGLLALVVMIDAEEQGKSHYRDMAKAVVETCGPAGGARPAAPPAVFGKELCGKLALAMLDSVENGKLDSPQFAKARDEFAGKCIGPAPAG